MVKFSEEQEKKLKRLFKKYLKKSKESASKIDKFRFAPKTQAEINALKRNTQNQEQYRKQAKAEFEKITGLNYENFIKNNNNKFLSYFK